MSKQLTDESLQQIKKNLPPDELAVFQLLLSDYHSKLSQVEEMQKTIDHVIEESRWGDPENALEKVVNTLQSLKGDKP